MNIAHLNQDHQLYELLSESKHVSAVLCVGNIKKIKTYPTLKNSACFIVHACGGTITAAFQYLV